MDSSPVARGHREVVGSNGDDGMPLRVSGRRGGRNKRNSPLSDAVTPVDSHGQTTRSRRGGSGKGRRGGRGSGPQRDTVYLDNPVYPQSIKEVRTCLGNTASTAG